MAHINNMTKKIRNSSKHRFLKAVEIQPQDDTYHGNIKLLDIEWWYFDAVLENGYSVHIGFRIYHVRGFGILQSRIDIYKDGKVIVEELKIDLFSKFVVDTHFPTINVGDKTVVKFDNDAYKKDKLWRYNVKLSIDDNAVDLLFTGTTKGWKIETPDACWAVPLPKAVVTGELTINGEKLQVKGLGYHDHNWSYSPVTAMNNLGWYWGRISSDTVNITWAKIVQNKDRSDIIAVINKDKGGFYNINPENFDISTKDYERNNGGEIPKIFNLKINDKTNAKIYCEIKMNTTDTQYTRIFTIKYWRYHVMASGRITIDNYVEDIFEKPQIIEFLKFKSKNVN
jgi:predicted secreted hydrolase